MTFDSTFLVQAARKGDHEAFAQLVRRTRPLLRGIVGRRVGRGAADDLVQQTYLDAWKRLDALRDPARFTAWVVMIAVRNANRLAERHELEETILPKLAREEAQEVDLDEEPLIKPMREALETLDPETRSLLLLRFCDGHTPRQIAAASNLKPGVVRKRLSRGRAKLKQLLLGILEEDHDA